VSAGAEGLAAVVRAAEVVSPAGFRLAGRFFGTPAGVPQQPDGGALLPLLQAALYEHCYAHPFRGALHVPPALPPPDDDLVPSLAAAHPGRERWEAGWQIVQALPTGQVVANINGSTSATLNYTGAVSGTYYLLARDREGDNGGTFTIKYTQK